MLGYRPKVTKAATVDIDFYQQLPSVLDNTVYVPDYSYCLQFTENTQIRSSTNNSIFFLVQDNINFAVSSSTDPTEITVYQTSGGNPQYFLLKNCQWEPLSLQVKDCLSPILASLLLLYPH